MPEAGERRSETSRVEAFSDGVFAIAITLLVLDIRVPGDLQHGQLWHGLAQLWPSYAAYATSFFTIGIMWVNHHDLFTVIGSVDRGLLFLNLAVLGLIGFLPFPTAILARFLRSGGNDARAAAVLYGLTMVGVAFGWVLLWLRLHRHPELLADGVARSREESPMIRYVGPIAYTTATLLGFIAPLASLAIYFVTALFFASGRLRGGRGSALMKA